MFNCLPALHPYVNVNLKKISTTDNVLCRACAGDAVVG